MPQQELLDYISDSRSQGFSDKEIALARTKKACFVHLGDLILKTETAAIVGVSLVKYAFNL